MTRMLVLCLLMLGSPLLTVPQATRDDGTGDKSLILALESAWNQAEIHHDANAAAAILGETFISVDHHGKLQNRGQYLADIKDLSFSPEEISNSDPTVYLYGDTAIVTSAYRTTGTYNKKPFSHRGRFTDTWIKRNGKWQCIADQETLSN